ncbi:glycoside hydrolase family 5 protein [Spirochaeta dissipatitropha]
MNRNELPWLHTRKTKIVNDRGDEILLRGFGLGGWLLPEGYMWKMGGNYDRPRRMESLIASSCGQDFADEFWQQYYSSFITEHDIQWIHSRGFNSIRLPFNSRNLFNVSHEAVTFNSEILGYIDDCIEWCTNVGVYVILDMHGAPGGQTGTNIDDCENDEPELFLNPLYQTQCVHMWELIAERYADNSTIAGYDLLNEPLAPHFADLSEHVLPLYRRLTEAIRRIDKKHMLILEGTCWATEVDIFSPIKDAPLDANWVLQFHKYWNSPDTLSMKKFLDAGKDLDVPLFMGEGGENNLEWYTGVFPLLEALDISWNFWTYKKIACTNSPVSFPVPDCWPPDSSSGPQPWRDFLTNLSTRTYKNEAVIRAITREIPVRIPAVYFDHANIRRPRMPGADFRQDSQARIMFLDGHEGSPDFNCNAGQETDPAQRMMVHLSTSEELGYCITCNQAGIYKLKIELLVIEPGVLSISLDAQALISPAIEDTNRMLLEEHYVRIPEGKHRIALKTISGEIGIIGLEIGSA